MGTRALAHIKEGDDILCTIYFQFGGYPEGVGKDLHKYLSSGKLVNGIRLDEEGTIWNGMGCLAASLIKHLKNGPGGVYLEKPGVSDCGEEYTYTISGPEAWNVDESTEIGFEFKGGDDAYHGTVDDFGEYLFFDRGVKE
jgi:hypothetical protein